MTNRPRRQPDEAATDDGASGPSPSIPDGGLGSVMPEWMRETPSWKRVPEPLAVRSIPEPDTSVIDPRRLIGVDDLPEWLQAVAARTVDGPPNASPLKNPGRWSPVSRDDETVHREPVAPPAADREAPVLPVTARAGVQRPTERSGLSDLPHVRLTPSPSPVERPWWMSDVAVAALFVAIILTLIYVVLAASDVV